MSNPILVELTRGGLVESRHAGAFVVTRANGEIVVGLGDIERRIYPRSAIKALQALPLLESGAAERYGLGDAEIALACASHSGTERHATTAAGMLARAGLLPAALGCGAHAPGDETAAFELRRAGLAPGQEHNNCSGKHAGMLVTAAHMGEPTEGYLGLDHPVQQRIARVLAEVTGVEASREWVGVDGCSAPNWAMPLRALATAFARLGTGEGLEPSRARAARRLMEACWAEPEMMSGPGRLDARVLAEHPGSIFLKTGAEGVYCGALPEKGFGFALKIDDGAPRASQSVVKALVDRLTPGSAGVRNWADLTNWNGTVVGEIRGSGLLLRELYKLTR
jgi:L-asparaginase II